MTERCRAPRVVALRCVAFDAFVMYACYIRAADTLDTRLNLHVGRSHHRPDYTSRINHPAKLLYPSCNDPPPAEPVRRVEFASHGRRGQLQLLLNLHRFSRIILSPPHCADCPPAAPARAEGPGPIRQFGRAIHTTMNFGGSGAALCSSGGRVPRCQGPRRQARQSRVGTGSARSRRPVPRGQAGKLMAAPADAAGRRPSAVEQL
jgi:hypothetical protein